MRGPRRWELAFTNAKLIQQYEDHMGNIHAIAYLGIDARKDMLKVARCQRSVQSNPFLRSRIASCKPSYTCPQDLYLLDRFGKPTNKIVTELSDFVHKDPVAAAVVSNLCRSAPFFNISQSEINANTQASWEKEIAATQQIDRPQVLDYDVWFSSDPEAYKRPLSEHVPPAPGHNSRIRNGMHEWRSNMEGKILYPQIQANKTMSRSTAALYTEDTEHGFSAPKTDVSSATLEEYYATSGKKIAGPCELRQAWKYNDITPRTYFAQGGKTFHASKYIRDPINDLTNTFSEVNFHSRFSFHEMPLDSESDAFIYDYTSFTSLLAELKYFLSALADFCQDTTVYLVDSHQGLLETTLGSVIREYNEVCNIKGEFTIQRYQPEDTIPYNHQLAGFLGVYGNIASSTTLHGLHACQICGDASQCRCVGDDVFGILSLAKGATREDAIRAVESLGMIQRAKVKWWPFVDLEAEDSERDHTYTYLKRPFDRFGNRMTLEQALFLPIWGLINPIPDVLAREAEDIDTRVKLLATQTFACIKQARALYPPLELHQVDLLQCYLRSLYGALGFDFKGRLPFETIHIGKKKFDGLFIPSIEDGFLLQDPWEILASRWTSNQVLSLPMMVREPLDRTGELLRRPMTTTTTTISRTISYLREMGWLVATPQQNEVLLSFDEYRTFYELLFAGRLIQVYDAKLICNEYRIVKDLAALYELGLPE